MKGWNPITHARICGADDLDAPNEETTRVISGGDVKVRNVFVNSPMMRGPWSSTRTKTSYRSDVAFIEPLILELYYTIQT